MLTVTDLRIKLIYLSIKIMIHWTDIEKSKEGILQILHAEDIAQKVNPERLRFACRVTSVSSSLRRLGSSIRHMTMCFL